MFFIVLFLSIFVFVKTIGYAIYEYNDNNNKFAGIVIIVFGFISLIGPVIIKVIQ